MTATLPKAPLIAAVDVSYEDDEARVACVTFESWEDAVPASERVITMTPPAPYIPGAKNPFRPLPPCEQVRRGRSDKPLYVSAAGMAASAAAEQVAKLHGPHRIPTLLRRVDHLSRGRMSS